MKESFWDQAKDRLYIFKKKKNLPPSLLPYTHTQFGVPTSLYPQLELKDNLESKKKQWMRLNLKALSTLKTLEWVLFPAVWQTR